MDSAQVRSIRDKHPLIPLPPPQPGLSKTEHADYCIKYYTLMSEMLERSTPAAIAMRQAASASANASSTSSSSSSSRTKSSKPSKPAPPTTTSEILAAYSPIKNNPGPPEDSYWANNCFCCDTQRYSYGTGHDLEPFSDVMICRRCASEMFPNKRHQKRCGHGTINKSETMSLFNLSEAIVQKDIKFGIAHGVGMYGQSAYSYRIADILEYIQKRWGGLLARKRMQRDNQ